jgi:hypothetical protein
VVCQFRSSVTTFRNFLSQSHINHSGHRGTARHKMQFLSISPTPQFSNNGRDKRKATTNSSALASSAMACAGLFKYTSLVNICPSRMERTWSWPLRLQPIGVSISEQKLFMKVRHSSTIFPRIPLASLTSSKALTRIARLLVRWLLAKARAALHHDIACLFQSLYSVRHLYPSTCAAACSFTASRVQNELLMQSNTC